MLIGGPGYDDRNGGAGTDVCVDGDPGPVFACCNA